MKRFNLKVTLCLCVAAAMAMATAFYGCDKENNSSKEGAGTQAVKSEQTSCGEHFSDYCEKLGENERYDLRWVDDNQLEVTHVNWAAPCDLHDVTVDVKVEGNVVTVNECGDGGLANCICKIDNRFHIKNLPKGNYIFVFKICGEENHRQQCTL